MVVLVLLLDHSILADVMLQDLIHVGLNYAMSNLLGGILDDLHPHARGLFQIRNDLFVIRD